MFSKNEERNLLDAGFILLDEASWDTRESEPETDRSCCQGLFVHVQSCLTLRLQGLKPTRLLCPCDFPGKILWWVATSCSGDLPGLWMGPTPPASSGLARGFFTTVPPGILPIYPFVPQDGKTAAVQSPLARLPAPRSRALAPGDTAEQPWPCFPQPILVPFVIFKPLTAMWFKALICKETDR